MVLHCLWKMSATPGACIKPGLVRRPLCHKVNLPSCVVRQLLWHTVNLPRCEARRRHLIMTCNIFGTGQTNTLTLCYLLGKTYKPATVRSTKLLEKLLTWAAHVPLKAFTGLVRSLNSHLKAFKTVNSMKFILSTSWWLDALKITENYPKKCFWRKKNNPGLSTNQFLSNCPL